MFKREGSGIWIPHQDKIKAGLMVLKMVEFNDEKGKALSRVQSFFTAKGVTAIQLRLARDRQKEEKEREELEKNNQNEPPINEDEPFNTIS